VIAARPIGAAALAAVALLAGSLPAKAARAARVRVPVPDVAWSDLRAHVHANVVPYRDGDDFFVMICTGATLPAAVPGGFDPALSDFVKVLLLERAQRDGSFTAALRQVAASVRARLPLLPPEERARYRELFWRELDRNPVVQRGLERDLVAARRRGFLRCRACEGDEGFRPTAAAPPR
jgi:hypothetical protein